MENLLGQKHRRLALYKSDGSLLTESDDLLRHSGKSLHAFVLGEKPSGKLTDTPTPCCMFVNVQVLENGQKGTLLLANPHGDALTSTENLLKQVGYECYLLTFKQFQSHQSPNVLSV